MLPGKQHNIRSILKTLRRKRWLIALPLVVGATSGLIASRFLPSLYRSDALIQVVPQRVPESYVSATVTERVEDRLRAISQQVLSRTQLERLITDLGLFKEDRQRYPMEDVVQRMQSRVTIVPVESEGTSRAGNSEAFRIAFEYEDATTAQKVAERLASFFIDTNARERGSQAEQTSAFLEAQMADARSRLEAQEQKLKDFRERNAGRLPTQAQANMQAIQNLQLSLQAMVESLARDKDRKLILERLHNEATAETEAAAATPPSAPRDPVTGAPADATPSQRLEAAKAVLAQMETRLSDRHPDVVRMKRLITDLEAQVTSGTLLRPLGPDESTPAVPTTPDEARRRDRLREQRAELESLDRQIAFKTSEERRLRGVIASYQGRLEAVPGVESEWVALSRDYDTLQASYRELLAKSENSKMAASLEQRQIGEQFRILDPPRVPQKPFKPNRPLINSLSALGGLGLGLLLVGLSEVRDSTMRTEADVMGAVDLPVLVLLPYVTTADDLARKKRRTWLEIAAGLILLALVVAVVFTLKLWRYVL